MPLYEYHCRECGRDFSLRLHIEEHDSKRPKCPECGSPLKFNPFIVDSMRRCE